MDLQPPSNPIEQDATQNFATINQSNNSFGKTAFIILAIFISFSIGAAGMYLLIQQDYLERLGINMPITKTLTNKQNQLQPKPTTLIVSQEQNPVQKQQTPTISIDETAGWKTYEDPVYAYSIKYPSDKYFRLICPGEGFALNLKEYFAEGTTDPVTMPSCERGGRWEVEMNVYDSSQEVEPKSDEYYSVIKELIKLDGTQAKKYTFTPIQTPEQAEGPPAVWYMIVIINKDGKTYDMHFGRQTDIDYYNKMLSTFKFIE
jgi:hypothetical protein